MSASGTRYPIVVVGAGPVGVTAANLLGTYGVPTLLVDRETSVVDYPRAIGVDDEALRTFQTFGLADDILGDAIQNVPLKFFDARGRCVADVRPTHQEYGWYRRNVFVQPAAEAAGQSPPPEAWTRLLVDAVMSRDPVTAFADDSLRTVLERMGRLGIRHVPVVDGDRGVIGILSDRDVRTAIGNPLRALDTRSAIVRIESTRVSHVMSRSPVTIPAGTRLSRAAALFVDQKIGLVAVVDDAEHLLGVVSYTDVLRAILGVKPSTN